MNESDKFRFGMMETALLGRSAQYSKRRIDECKALCKWYGKEDSRYSGWKREIDKHKRQRKYILALIEKRQMKLPGF